MLFEDIEDFYGLVYVCKFIENISVEAVYNYFSCSYNFLDVYLGFVFSNARIYQTLNVIFIGFYDTFLFTIVCCEMIL